MRILPLLLAAGLAASTAYAQARVKPGGYPAKPVRIVIGYPAGITPE